MNTGLKYICVLLAVGYVAANDLKGVDPNTLSCDPEGHVFLLLPHFTDCNKYYMCAHGKEVEFTCSASTIFDFEYQTCNWKWDTKCWLRGEPAIDGSGDDSWTPEESSGSFDNGAGTVDEHKFRPDLRCNVASSASRRVPYKGDCQRYWHCRGADLTVAYCSDGLYFNAQTQQCDYEANVQCNVQQEDELKGEFIVYKK